MTGQVFVLASNQSTKPAQMDDFATSNRDLVARVAALELLVADLVHVLWQVSPTAMNKLANDAAHDLEIGHTRVALPVGDHQRDRLYAVLRSRQRMLKRKAAIEA